MAKKNNDKDNTPLDLKARIDALETVKNHKEVRRNFIQRLQTLGSRGKGLLKPLNALGELEVELEEEKEMRGLGIIKPPEKLTAIRRTYSLLLEAVQLLEGRSVGFEDEVREKLGQFAEALEIARACHVDEAKKASAPEPVPEPPAPTVVKTPAPAASPLSPPKVVTIISAGGESLDDRERREQINADNLVKAQEVLRKILSTEKEKVNPNILGNNLFRLETACFYFYGSLDHQKWPEEERELYERAAALRDELESAAKAEAEARMPELPAPPSEPLPAPSHERREEKTERGGRQEEVELRAGDYAYYYRGRQNGEEIYEQVLVEGPNGDNAHCQVFDRSRVKGQEKQEHDINIRKLSSKVPEGAVIIFLPDNMREEKERKTRRGKEPVAHVAIPVTRVEAPAPVPVELPAPAAATVVGVEAEAEPQPEAGPPLAEAERKIKLLDWQKCGEYRFYTGQTVVFKNGKSGAVKLIDTGGLDFIVVIDDKNEEHTIFDEELSKELQPTAAMRIVDGGAMTDERKKYLYQGEIGQWRALFVERLKKKKGKLDLAYASVEADYGSILREYFEQAAASYDGDIKRFLDEERQALDAALGGYAGEAADKLNELFSDWRKWFIESQRFMERKEAKQRTEEIARARRVGAPAPAVAPAPAERGVAATVAPRETFAATASGGGTARPMEARTEAPQKFKFGGKEYTVGEVRKIMTIHGEKKIKIIGLAENAGRPSQITYAILDKHGGQAGISTVDEKNWKEFVLFDLTDLESQMKPLTMPAQPEAPGQPNMPEINIVIPSPPSRKRTGSGRLKKWLVGAGAALGIASLGAAGGVSFHEHHKGEEQEEKIGREKSALETLKQQMLERLGDFSAVDLRIAQILSSMKEKIKNAESFNEPNFFAGMSPEEATIFNFAATGSFLGKVRGIDGSAVYADGSTAFIFEKDGRKFLGSSNTRLKVVGGEFVGWYNGSWRPFAGKFTETGGISFEMVE